ncbi:hypothetical protein ACU686_03350 [Yinghuangia aomiensis]
MVPETSLAGPVAGDVMHLLSEIVENATSFSPPHTKVGISAEIVPNGLGIEIEDRGLGMSAEALDEANRLLATAQEFNVMGFTQDSRIGPLRRRPARPSARHLGQPALLAVRRYVRGSSCCRRACWTTGTRTARNPTTTAPTATPARSAGTALPHHRGPSPCPLRRSRSGPPRHRPPSQPPPPPPAYAPLVPFPGRQSHAHPHVHADVRPPRRPPDRRRLARNAGSPAGSAKPISARNCCVRPPPSPHIPGRTSSSAPPTRSGTPCRPSSAVRPKGARTPTDSSGLGGAPENPNPQGQW